MSRYAYNGIKVSTSYGALENTMSEAQVQASQELRKFYHPLEIDMTIPFEQKFQFMEEWHHRGNAIICDPPFSSLRLKDAVSRGHIVLRNGTDDLLTFVHQQGIKMFIVSAGVGNVISYCLEGYFGFESVEIFSNVIDFDTEEMSTGFRSPVMHSLSKPRALTTKHLKKNVILLGDMPHDLLMVGHHDQDHVLSIGYYNDETKFDLANYTDRFDVVVKNDGNLKVVELLLNLICGASKHLEELVTLKPLVDCLAS